MVVSIPVPKVSTHSGMGSILFPGGVAFRVWAPFASEIKVAFYDSQDQDNSSPSRLASLALEGNGYWSTDVSGIAAGQLYLYEITNPDIANVFYKIDPYVKEITNPNNDPNGKGVVRESDFPWTDDSFTMPDYNSLIVYELHLGTFDGISGTLAGAASRLPHLNDLGINCVHLMPPHEFYTNESWGFNVAFPFAVEDDYGGIVEFKKFVDLAHRFGIAVITDCIFNHYGPQGLESGLGSFDGWNQNVVNPVNGDVFPGNGIYFYNDDRWYTQWGHRPDFGRPEVRQFIRDNVMFLFDECHCDGVRLDSTSNVWGFTSGIDQGVNRNGDWNSDGYNLLRWISDEKNYFYKYPHHKILIAEDWRNDGWVTRPTPSGGAGMDAEWHWFVHAIRPVLTNSLDQYRDLSNISNALYARFNGDAFKRVIYSQSHDESGNQGDDKHNALARLIDPQNSESWFAKKRTALAAVLTLSAPGIPMIWQGQELFSIEKFSDQVPLDWSRKDRFNGYFQLYRRLCHLRRNWDNNTRGLRGQHINCHVLDNLNKVIAFHRWNEGGPGDDVVVVVNFADRTWDSYRVGLPRWGTWWCRFSSDWSGYSDDFGNVGGHPVSAEPVPKDTMAQSAGFSIGPYSALIYSQ